MNRVSTSLVLTAILLALWAIQGPVLRVVLTGVTCLCVWEVYNAFMARGMRPSRWVGMGYAVLSMPVYLLGGADLVLPLLAAACIVGLAAVLLRGEPDFDTAVATLFPVFYPGLMCTLLYPMQDLGNPLIATLALGMAFLVSFASDISAYEVGCHWGRRKLAPRLSPKKTVEGAVGGMAGAAIMSVVLPVIFRAIAPTVPAFAPYADTLPNLWLFVPMGLIAGAASAIGDLAASMIKRYCGVKDYGNLLPGHGGLMDRIDSVLFNAVVVYAFFLMAL